MGAWSAAILGNDTSCEVYERFIELYNSGYDPGSISAIVLKEQQENLEYDRTNVWLALALACWECKVLTAQILKEVEVIVDTGEDIRYNEGLDAGAGFLKERKRVLVNFVKKLSVEKSKPRLKKKDPVKIESVFCAGMCLTYQNQQKKYIGIYITRSEHFKNKGSISFWLLNFESAQLPLMQTFLEARPIGLKELGPEWTSRRYMGHHTEISYTKDSKAAFFQNVPALLHLVGKLPAYDDSVTNNSKWHYMDLYNPDSIITEIELIRTEWATLSPATLTLGKLLKIAGVS
ncbi:hypothetical protein DYU05_17170 [Mucilaginibacter terrenus]|uniref:DUF4259 domain-containing protein n=1 Tax=Mucilaginibacter terrenus TaxID=2482727 RepID=A0A3E2NN74_9SPHI|nr:hypothetical protein [Mucilaginibacter terrenus]RFZ82340.1 hypothetical protein DYU05_17170 [Mucilaginibacter terrenus]